METKQQYNHTIQSVKKNADTWIAKASTGLLNEYRFDKPYCLDTKKYLLVSTFSQLLCSDMGCDFDWCERRLEKTNIYIQQK